MKKNYLAIAAIAAGALVMASCSGNKTEKAETAADSTEEYKSVPVPTADEIFASYRTDSVADTIATTTASGLRYMTLKEGTGASPKATDVVKVHYTGKLPDGTIFDSSVQRGEPISFPLNGVIAGWTEGLQLMKEGGKTVFYIPSQLAYGAAGAGPMIGPDQDLVFEVELIEVNPKE
ncbi:MAG: FKBP-type peptidyl-prolyl cis-trans isomerase [Muribaculaceae bacterium]|nr:FKBP-type peptidyl-prolyl cis-trans isomerase [Muribaculaceae bacterium]